jgi:UDP-N-acetylglucosamine--N-acetylmuramyl-(pentapeptide) pyrophosphoryl-undecaprenol N-acetylglucosamine transferase
MGGSQGSIRINECVRELLPQLLRQYNIVHLCGKGNLLPEADAPGYKQFEYVSEELPHLLAYASMAVSRAGANSITEFLALRKPNLLIPLSREASRGDQILNARSYEKQGFSQVLFEEDLSPETLLRKINDVYAHRTEYMKNMLASEHADGTKDVLKLIEVVYGGSRNTK